jgi:hypothetical protein
MTDKASYVLRKVFSGRWLATLGVVVVYIWASTHSILSAEAIEKVTLVVMAFYFGTRAGKETPQ